MMRIFFLIAIFLSVWVSGKPVSAMTEQVAIVVNENAITVSDINDRIRLIMASSGLPNTPEVIANLRPQIISALVDEQIRIQEADRLEITINQGEINQKLEELAKSNNFTSEQFREVLKRSGVNIKTLEAQFRAQVAWLKVVQTELRPKIKVSELDIQNTLERFENNKGKTEYLVAEIFLPVDDRKEENKVRKLALDISSEIRAGKVRFSRMAQQFSKSAGAAQGGDLGWLQEGQLEKDLDAAIRITEKGGITAPIRTSTGIHVLLVRDQRLISDETIPSRDDILNSLGQQRLQNQARRYLLDLKSSAFIDNRLES